MNEIISTLRDSLGDVVPGALAALAILIIGWFVAVLFRAGTRKSLSAVGLNERAFGDREDAMDLEGLISKGVFWLIMLFVLIAFFNKIDLPAVSGPLDGLLDQVMAFLPKLIAGAVLAVVAWIIGTVFKKGATAALSSTKLDEKLSSHADMQPMSQTAGNMLFWLVILLFLPAILSTLELGGLLAPVQNMVDEIVGLLPNILAAGAIGFVGWFIAKILRDLVTNVLGAAGADKWGQKMGLVSQADGVSGNGLGVSKLAGTLVFFFVFVPALIAALNALGVEAISGPATDMLGKIMNSIPNILGAVIILVLSYFVARLVAGIITSVAASAGADALPQKVGMQRLFANTKPSDLAGKLLIFFTMLFAGVEAANRLGFSQVGELVGMFTQLSGQILLGSVILGIGVWLANLAGDALARTGSSAAPIVRFAVIGLVSAMGLRAMGIADDIVNLAFGLILGAIAVAVALSFGLGGRDAAGKLADSWVSKWTR